MAEQLGLSVASEADLSQQEHADGSSFLELSLVQHASGGKARLESLRENLSKQQERLTALRERALRKTEDGGKRKSSISDSMESLKSLGQKLTVLKTRSGSKITPAELPQELTPQFVSTPLVTPIKDGPPPSLEFSGSEKLHMLNQRTEQNRALLEQRKRDMAISLQSVKSGLRHSASGELGASLSDLAQISSTSVMSRHRSAADLQQQQQEASDESRLKLLKNKMKLIELKQSRKEQELQQELLEVRNELAKREELHNSLTEQSERDHARLHAEIEQLRSRNAELENSNELLETTRLELHNAREQLLEEQTATVVDNTDTQVNVELAKQLQELESQLQQLRSSNAEQTSQVLNAASESERLALLEATIETQRNELAAQSEQLAEKTTELNVLNVNLRVLEEKLAQSVKSKPIFLDEPVDNDASEQLQQLKQKLDECNKSNIKLKLKCKQAEKQLQKLQSIDVQQQLAKLTADNEQLQQRIIVLEDEKGQWQLAHVEEEELETRSERHPETAAAKHSGQTETIRLLEEQKEELQQALEALQLGSESARVESELNEAQLEEQLSQRVQQLETEANEQRQHLQTLQTEKEALDKKLTHYINENMELLDKLEKLSSSSSAESIEIVERPTERRFSQRPASDGEADVDATEPTVLPSFVSELTQTDLAASELEVNESFAQLRNESDELLKKIELFTTERREVLAKMEVLQTENAANATLRDQLQLAQEQLQAQYDALQTQLNLSKEQLLAEQAAHQAQLEELQRDKQHLSLQLSEKSNLSQELSSMQRSSEVVAALDCGEAGSAALFDKCERSLSKLSSELESYRKANDRNAKLNVSKKLAKEAKNVHTQLTELLHKVKEASTAVETVTVVETVVAVTAPNGKALAEYEQLTAQNAELKLALAALQAELSERRDSYEMPDLPKLTIGNQEEEQEHQQEREKQLEREQQQRQKIEQLTLQLEQLQAQLEQAQVERKQLQLTIEDLRSNEAEHLQLIGSQSAQLTQLQLQAEQYDQTLNSSEMVHEKHMEQQQRQRQELESRIETLEGELRILQTLAAEQKQQLIESYSASEHESNLKLLELQQCQQELETSESRNKELREKLKKYALNLKKRAAEHVEQEQQLLLLQSERNSQLEQVQQLQQQLQQSQHAEQQQHDVDSLKEELTQLRDAKSQQSEVEQATISRLKHELHSSLEANQLLQQKLATLSQAKDEVDRLQVELENTVQAHTALRQQIHKLEQSLAAQSFAFDESQRTIDQLRHQLEQRSLKLNKSKEVIKLRNASIHNLQRELNELSAQRQAQPAEDQSQLQEQLKVALAQNAVLSDEKANFELTVARLETLHEGIQAKLLQDQSYIESLETQNAELHAKLAALEDQAATLTAQQGTAQEQVQLLEQQLRERATQQLEHEAQQAARLHQLTEHEQSQSRQLQQLSNEAEEVREQLAQLQATHDALVAWHKQHAQQAQQELVAREQLSSNSEQELLELRTELQTRDKELQRQRQVYDAKLAAKATELDELECDLSAHMERATAETRDLTQQLERAQEQLQLRAEESARLNEDLVDVERERAALNREVTLLRLQHDSAEQDSLELQELRMQALQDKTEMDNLRTQIESLCSNHNQELQALQQQIAEQDTLGQNQTDDQVYIETENKRLTEQLAELQARLDEQTEQLNRQPAAAAAFFQPAAPAAPQASVDWMYQTAWQPPNNVSTQRIPTAQMSAEQSHPIPAPAMFFGGDAAAVPSPFDEIVAAPLRIGTQELGVGLTAQVEPHDVEATIEDLQRNVSDLEKHAKELETKLLARNQALAEHDERRAQLERLLCEREQELAQLRAAAEEQQRLAAIEQLIQPEQQVTPAVPTLNTFFGAETKTDFAAGNLELFQTQTEPVVEQMIVPKKAYLCQPELTQAVHSEWGVDMDEDPWASAAAAVEQQPDTAAMTQLQAKITELERQKAELQTKTAKLIKRVKEYRSKEQQELSKSVDNDLDSAIIEELKHQLQLLETRQSKTDELLQQHAQEKERLTKRIDVLTAGNERMAELKERQDMDVKMYQARIRELQEKLQQLESWGDDAATATPKTTAVAAATTPSDAEALTKIENLLAENQDLNTECQELQAQLQQEKQLAEQAIAQAQRLQAEKQLALDALGQQSELERKQHQADHQAVEQERQAVEQERQQLQLQLEELKSKQLELPSAVSAPSDESIVLLQERESEIVHLKQRIEELMREDQTEKLVFEILTKNQELQLLRMQVKQLEEDKLEQLEKQKEQQQLLEQQSSLQPEVTSETQAETSQELEQMRLQYAQLQQEKQDMEEELRVLNNHVLSSLELEDKMKQSVLEQDMQTIEITELRKTLELLQRSQAQAPPVAAPAPAPPQPDLAALNQQWEALVEQKCSEVASVWQEHLAQREAAYKAQIEQLVAQAEARPEQPALIAHVTQQQTTTEDISEMLDKMQKALETQEMEIVTLKEQLAIRSAEYARLASQYDPFRLQNTLGGSAAPSAVQDAQSEYVLKSDLDYALMMLHQRDMRVEEMILELVQLLEERDHLQLKLSDTLRQLETERSRSHDDSGFSAAPVSMSSTGSGSPNTIHIVSSSEQPVAARGSDLKQKLAELQTVKHSKDKAIVDEREQRLQQMIQLQRDMAKPATSTATTNPITLNPTIPAATGAEATTQSQDVDSSQQSLRSPSMVLMDWILGNNKSEDEAQTQAPASN